MPGKRKRRTQKYKNKSRRKSTYKKQTKKQPKKQPKNQHKKQTRRKKRSSLRNSGKHVKKYKTEKCAPKTKDDDILGYTCYSSTSLHKMKSIWNKKHPDLKINSNNPKTIWENLRFIFQKTCKKESCWLKHKCLNENISLDTKSNTFAPTAPEEWKAKPDEWLSSIEIMEVMKQYEKSYQCFEFIGPSPIDYDKHLSYGECVWEELCKFSLKDNIKKGKNKVGVIFNLDKHDKEGSHWVGLFINIKKSMIYYLDSYGEEIPGQINKFVNKIKKQANALNLKKFTLRENRRRHQFSDSECGMYSLYFIIYMLKNDNFGKFTKQRIKDDYMKKLRKMYFNH